MDNGMLYFGVPLIVIAWVAAYFAVDAYVFCCRLNAMVKALRDGPILMFGEDDDEG